MDKSDYIQKRDHHAALFVCAVIIAALLLVILCAPKSGIPAAREKKAVTALLDAEARLTSTSQYGGPHDFDEECDAILDDIRDALAWLDAEAS